MSALSKILQDLQDSENKGLLFEKLCLYFLKHDKLQQERFSDVWLWKDYPDNNGMPDTGIDIVAKYKGRESLCAVQCKFRQNDSSITKDELDSFLSLSSKSKYSGRILFTVSGDFGKNAKDSLTDQNPSVKVMTLSDLEASSINWDSFSFSNPDSVRYTVKKLRKHQINAVNDVLKGFETHDRGKLIMACGTGKTFTSLKIAEQFAGKSGNILVLTPSISLLNQSVLAWNYDHDPNIPMLSFAVCSDKTVGRKNDPDEDMKLTDLSFDATTDAKSFMRAWQNSAGQSESMTVIFSTYQSLQTVHDAQDLGFPKFDLVICDEAHRTAGVTPEGMNDSYFRLVHDDTFIRARKRLYMTATPKIFGDTPQKKAALQKKALENNAVLYSMDDEKFYGPEFHRLSFSQAVNENLLTDYKVMIFMVEAGDLRELNDTAMTEGVCKALAKEIASEDYDFISSDPFPMHKAVNFTGTIKQSEIFTDKFPVTDNITFRAKHIDGTKSASVRASSIHWLAVESDAQECRILSNARCLSEGVDVPALDAVIFFSPKRSQIDIVQSVGRVMRKAEGKKFGYVILPVAINPNESPEDELDKNESYNAVWKVLQALRAHDDHFDAVVNSLDLNRKNSKVRVTGGNKPINDSFTQEIAEKWKQEIYIRIVRKCGDREYWDKWVSDLAVVAENHSTILKEALKNQNVKRAFEEFADSLRSNINPSVTNEDAASMLSQHMVSRRVFDKLFSSFSMLNPVSHDMQKMLDILSKYGVNPSTERLEKFYGHVQEAVNEAKTDEAKQRLIRRIYENFFRLAFPDTAEKLGIVYTPEEIVDFILRSADWALREELGITEGLSANGVHILDPFSGTGTFTARLIQSGVISREILGHKYQNEIHANEILLLAYYISAINIESAFHQINGGSYTPFQGMVLADTFMLNKDKILPLDPMFFENGERAYKQERRDITVIIGNPPYNVGEKIDYTVDQSIEESYSKKSTATLKRALYDSYIRAIRWATDRLEGNSGIICFVTNASFIDGNAMDGMRKSLADDFSSIYIFNLRGNQRGGDWRKEGGKVFGEGSQLPVAITLFVKNKRKDRGQCRIYYYECEDYMRREDKLSELIVRNNFGAMIESGLMERISPNGFGDWIKQRSETFEEFVNLGNKNESREAIFEDRYSRGVVTGHDAYSCNFSHEALCRNMKVFAPDRFNEKVMRVVLYSPYVKTNVHFTHDTIQRVYQMPQIFPNSDSENKLICISGLGSKKDFSVLITDCITNLHVIENSQCFPLYWYERKYDGFILREIKRVNAVNDSELERFRERYNDSEITAEDLFLYIYGVLSSREYAERFGDDTKKVLARVPFVKDAETFREFVRIGRELGNLHVNYETAEKWPVTLEGDLSDLRITKMKIPERNGEKVIHYNDGLTISGIPREAWEYRVNGKSALEWIVDRYKDDTDKASGIRNDCNAWGREHGNESYVLDLIQRVVTVSVRTVEILRGMPELGV